ncbi:hypothetical protein KEM09_20755 [Carboxylicivirga mesophila]|uniref:Uncharacterized protein n=1 Tax=Carboxylicivirga mesophila TaxID=1166478 RepID=A0ABS5KFR8_9BACT|nr:hypothetical protein [Carboxylicivirga mesophila]MBS2213851.1 hypothetical protein [Carboxylicivirga mesophila]
MKTVSGIYSIEISDDSTYTPNSTDNINSYDLQYSYGGGWLHGNMSYTRTAVRVFDDSCQIRSAIICERGATIESYSSYVIKDSVLYIIAGTMVYALKIPELSIKWVYEYDTVCCLAIYNLEKDLLIHGELDIIRIDTEGRLKWRFGGRESWLNPGVQTEVTIENNQIKLIDFDSNEYVIDFDGNLKQDRKRRWKLF